MLMNMLKILTTDLSFPFPLNRKKEVIFLRVVSHYAAVVVCIELQPSRVCVSHNADWSCVHQENMQTPLRRKTSMFTSFILLEYSDNNNDGIKENAHHTNFNNQKMIGWYANRST